MGGGKKNKRKSTSTNSTSAASISITNGNDSDYGVFSDPDEMSDSSSPLKKHKQKNSDNVAVVNAVVDIVVETEVDDDIDKNANANANNAYIVASKSSTSDNITANTVYGTPISKISPSIHYDKSLGALKLKLQKDPEFSRKMTNATFFSFIILAMELERACSPSLAPFSIENTEFLIEYIITNHSSTSEVEQFTRTMLNTEVVRHLIYGIIDFNINTTTTAGSRFGTIEIQSLEQLDVVSSTATAPANVTLADETSTTTPSSPPPPRPSKFIQFWRNMTCCCRCRKSRKNSIILSESDEHTSTSTNTTTLSIPSSSTISEELKELPS